MIEIKIAPDYSPDGIAIWVSRRIDGLGRKVLHLDGNRQSWDDTPASAETDPTLRLEDDAGRALLDALTRHYQGTADLHTARADLLHERGRVDRLLAALTELAVRPQTIQLRKAEQ
jgi:hypothetical protein